MKRNFIVDSGPFIHLNQISQISLLERFPFLFVPTSVIAEINIGDEVLPQRISTWNNLTIVRVKEKVIPKIEKAVKKFDLHAGERDVLYLSSRFSPSIVLTDDLDGRNACESLGIEVHGTVGIIAYAFHKRGLSFKEAEESLLLLYRKSSLFVTFAIIERAIKELRM